MPDYEIVVGEVEVAVEVKQIEPNAEDRDLLGGLANGQAVSYWVNMSRARQSMLDAARQLRAHTKGQRPAIVVLFEMVSMFGYLDADSIAQCLYGPKEVHIAVPNDPDQESWVLGSARGGGRVATKDHNTTISAVAVLRVSEDAETMSVFHNRFAAVPIAPHQFRFDGVRHFAWRSAAPDSPPAWMEITSHAV